MTSTQDDKQRVGLVTDVGYIDDGTFNQYAYEGLVRAAEAHDLELQIVETGASTAYESNVHQLIENGCNPIVTIGSTMGAVVEQLGARFPSIHFIAVDFEPSFKSDNITGLVFAEDQAGFLAGALAGLVTKSNVVGFVGGVGVAPVKKFMAGFEHGLAHTNRRAELASTFTDSFTDLEAGQKAAQELAAQNADVIFAAGGQSGSTAIKTAAEAGAWVIGVDQDEWVTTFNNGETAGSDRLLTSAIKHVDEAVYQAVGLAVEGQLEGGVIEFSLENQGVGLASYHLADTAVPSEVRGKIKEVEESLRTGRIKTYVGPQGEDLSGGFFKRITTWDWNSALILFLAIFTALLIGAVAIAAFDPAVWEAFKEGPIAGLGAAFSSIVTAYRFFFRGAFGNPVEIYQGFVGWRQTGDSAALRSALYPLTEGLRMSTPYIFAGLAVALGFRAGLFNIGAEGQYFIGGLSSVFIGYFGVPIPTIAANPGGVLPFALQVIGWHPPMIIHLPVAILAGMLGGGLWAAIAGFLKARTGAHEVINTIMLNYVAYRLADFLLQVGGPMARPNDSRPVSPEVLPTAYLPQFFPNDPAIRVNSGLILALIMVAVVYWLLFKTTIGFEIRTVGANPRAARTAGISVERSIVVAMALSGALAGLAGVHDILGVTRYMPNAFFSGYGFDAIAVALLGKSHPVGVLLGALLFGFMRAGAQGMQGGAFVPIDIISILQGLIIIFIAAPEVIRLLYRLRARVETAETVFTRGWGSI